MDGAGTGETWKIDDPEVARDVEEFMELTLDWLGKFA